MICQNCYKEYDLDFFGMNQILCDRCQFHKWREESMQKVDEIEYDELAVTMYEGPQFIMDLPSWAILPNMGESIEVESKIYRVVDVRYRHFHGRGQEIRIEVEATKG